MIDMLNKTTPYRKLFSIERSFWNPRYCRNKKNE